MASKQIHDECKMGEAIVTAGRTWACEIGVRRAKQLDELGLGGPAVERGICQTIERDMDALAQRGQRLQESDTDVDSADCCDPGTLARRDEACTRTRDGLVRLREVVGAVAGDVATRELGFVGDTAREPLAVEELAGRVLGRVAKVKLTGLAPGVTLDLGALTAGLAGDYQVLVQGNADVQSAKRGAQLARVRRDELWASYTRERTSAAARLDADLRAVGLDEAADRLTPTARKPAATDESAAAKDATKTEPKRAEKKSVKGVVAKPAEAKPGVAEPSAEVKAAPVVTPPINTRPSLPPAQPS
jgi:hypothetical protein